MSSQYHATPYDQSAVGFYFGTYEDYQKQSVIHKNKYGYYVDEFEIQYIDGDNAALFDALGVNQVNLKQWFDDFEDMDGEDCVKAIYLAEHLGADMADILDQLEDVCLFGGTAKDHAENYIEECGLLDEMPENLRFYFDVEAFARDMLLSGDVTEITIMGATYTVWGC